MTPADRLALAWSERVRANRDQAERVREETPSDFYAPVTHRFVVDPRRTDDPTLGALLALARPDETWLDIGAGAGRFALPLALHVREVVALDPSPSMLRGLREGMVEHGIENIRVLEGRWPLDPAARAAVGLPRTVDVSLLAHVGYDIEEIGPFLDAAEAVARRICVAVFAERAPATPAAAFWPAVHGEDRHLLPALPEFEALLRARGTPPKVAIVERGRRVFDDRDDALRWLRLQCFIAAGGPAEARLVAALDGIAVDADGHITISEQPVGVGVVTWQPSRS